MQARALFPWFLMLLLILSGSARAEEWQVTVGGKGGEHAIWTLKRSAANGLNGTGKITKSDGSTPSAIIVGNAKNFLVTEEPSGHGCYYRALKLSANEASGTRHCDGRETPWNASIANPTDMSLPVLLKAGEDPRSGAAFKALSESEKEKAGREAREFSANMKVETAFSEIRDMNCLADQYLDIRLQKSNWSEQEILFFIKNTCVVPELVHEHAAKLCAVLFPRDPKLTGPLENIPGFCDCYSDHFTTHFMDSPNKANLAAESAISSAAVGECKKHS